MSEYKAGTVAKATVRGQQDVLVVKSKHDFWYSPEHTVDYMSTHRDHDVTDIRPLVVLTPEDSPLGEMRDRSPERMRTYAKYVEDSGAYTAADVLRWIADQVEEQAKPARIPEPGWDGCVRAKTALRGEEREFIRYSTRMNLYTWHDGDSAYRWDQLIDPVLVREGVDV